jgi:hypothetical protein
VAVKRRNRGNKQTKQRDLSAIAIVAAACFFLAIDSRHIYFAVVFTAQAVAAAVLAIRIAEAPQKLQTAWFGASVSAA